LGSLEGGETKGERCPPLMFLGSVTIKKAAEFTLVERKKLGTRETPGQKTGAHNR